jgi:hypothetical protein
MHGTEYVVLSGEPAQLDAVLAEMRPVWKLDAKAVNNGVGFARIKADMNVPYREIGALIIDAQQRRVAVTFFTDPLICGLDEDDQ